MKPTKNLLDEIKKIVAHWDDHCYYDDMPQPYMLKIALEQATRDIEAIINREVRIGRVFIT